MTKTEVDHCGAGAGVVACVETNSAQPGNGLFRLRQPAVFVSQSGLHGAIPAPGLFVRNGLAFPLTAEYANGMTVGIRKLFVANLSAGDGSGAVPDDEEWWRGAWLATNDASGQLTVANPFGQTDIPDDTELTLEVAEIDGQDNPFDGFTNHSWTAATMSGNVAIPLVAPTNCGAAAFVLTLSSEKYGLQAKDRVRVGVAAADLDIDSDNDDGFAPPGRDGEEDAVEDNEDEPGKILLVNDGDADFDGIPDYADGYNLLAADTDDDASAGAAFVPVVFTLSDAIDPARAAVRVTYPASDPGDVQVSTQGVYSLTGDGRLRLWARDGSVARSTNPVWHAAAPGDYLPPTPSGGVPAALLGFSSGVRTITFYAEAVRPSDATADLRILFEVDPDGEINGQPHPGFIAADAVRTTAIKVEFVHADGPHEGDPMDYLPVFRPSPGVNAGVPTYSSPDPVLALTFTGVLNPSIADSISVAYLGTNYVTTETGTNTLLFWDSNNVMSVTLLDTPLADTNVQEYLNAVIDLPADGVNSAKYECIETTASSLEFVNSPRGIVMTISDAGPLTNDAVHIKLVGTLVHEWDPVETGSNSLTFVDGNLKIQLIGNSTLTANPDTLLVGIFDSGQLSNTVFKLHETGPTTKVFRNYADPIPTSIDDTTVPDFVPWRVKVHGISDPNLLTSFVLNSSVDMNDQLTFTTVASLLSDQMVIVIPQSVDPADMPAGYSVLKVDDTDLDWNDTNVKEVTGDIQLLAMDSPARVVQAKVQADAVVLQSLPFKDRFLQGLDPEGKIRSPLLAMGYSAIRDYHAKKADTLAKYIKGKQVWYSMSHGGTEDGTSYSEFTGLVFTDGGIRASDIMGLGLNYRLVVVDGCCSAQTSTLSRDDAKTSNTLTSGAQTFANAFGADAAYMGWAWEMNPCGAQAWSTVFVNNLKYQSSLGRGRTVQEAYDQFIHDYYEIQQLPAAKYMKIYRNTGNVVDLRTSPR